jgi:SAM-dependent methyltransferase
MPSLDYEKIARYYDSYVQVNFDIKYFLEEAKKVSGRVLELMSGTGRVSIPLIEAGVNLTCVDISSEMLNIFKKKIDEKKLSVDIFEMDVCEMSLKDKFDLIIIPFHAFAELVSITQQHSALENIYKHLSDDGRFICTLHNPNIRLKSSSGDIKLIGKFPVKNEDKILFLWCSENYDEKKKIVNGFQFYELYDKDGKYCSKSFLDINFYVHDKFSFELLIQGIGFKVETLYGNYSYGTYVRDVSPVMVWVLKK